MPNLFDDDLIIELDDDLIIVPPKKHNELENLDFEHSGHTGFTPSILSLLGDVDSQTANAVFYVLGNVNNVAKKMSLADLLTRVIRTSNTLPSDLQEGQYFIKNTNGNNYQLFKVGANNELIAIQLETNADNVVETENKKVMTAQERTKLNGIENGAQVNTIEGIKVNGVIITPDGEKIVNIPMPTDVGADLSYNATTGVLSLVDKNGNVLGSVDLPLELLIQSGYYDSTNREIVLVLANNTPQVPSQIRIPVGDLVDVYTGDNVNIEVDSNNVIKFTQAFLTRIANIETSLTTFQAKAIEKTRVGLVGSVSFTQDEYEKIENGAMVIVTDTSDNTKHTFIPYKKDSNGITLLNDEEFSKTVPLTYTKLSDLPNYDTIQPDPNETYYLLVGGNYVPTTATWENIVNYWAQVKNSFYIVATFDSPKVYKKQLTINTSYSGTISDYELLFNGKQDALTPGNSVDITNNVIKVVLDNYQGSNAVQLSAGANKVIIPYASVEEEYVHPTGDFDANETYYVLSGGNYVVNSNITQANYETFKPYIYIKQATQPKEITFQSKSGTVALLSDITNYQEVTYQTLKTLRANSLLVKGKQYRITDYQCTTTQVRTRSANHQFDIIVVADDVNKLNENARAILHSGDTYFANSKLEAWQLKYCLDNDTNRFAWADTTNGKGVIYYMKDEYDNECPYDFKNIQYRRYNITASPSGITGVVGLMIRIGGSGIFPTGATYDETEYWFYTFDNNGTDSSLNGDSKYNKIPMDNVGYLNDIVLKGRSNLHNIFGLTNCEMTLYNASGNTFGWNCRQNVQQDGGSFTHNRIGARFTHNTFQTSVNHNVIGAECEYNEFYSLGYNDVGNNFRNNKFGGVTTHNSFGDYCWNIICAKKFEYNIVEVYCQYLEITADYLIHYIHICLGVGGSSTYNRLTINAQGSSLNTPFIYRKDNSTEVLV